MKQSQKAQTAQGAFAVTPSDTVNLSGDAANTKGYTGSFALYIGTTGNVKVKMADGVDVTFNSVPVGFMPISCLRVFATGTGASNIVALVQITG